MSRDHFITCASQFVDVQQTGLPYSTVQQREPLAYACSRAALQVVHPGPEVPCGERRPRPPKGVQLVRGGQPDHPNIGGGR